MKAIPSPLHGCSPSPHQDVELHQKITFEKLPHLFLKKGLAEKLTDDISLVLVKDSKEEKEITSPKKQRPKREVTQKKVKRLIPKQENSQELPEQKVMALKGLPLFQELNYRELLNIIEIIDLKTHKKGDIVIRENEQGETMFISF